MSAINIISLIIHQGLSNPLETIPYLIALLSDRLATIIEKSTRLLCYFYEKHPTFLCARLLEGIKLSYSFQMKAFSQYSVFTFAVPVESFLANLYGMLSSKFRFEFLSSMMKVFEDGIENEKILKYLSELLISLPFESGSEVFHMMHSINRIISLKASPISRQLKPFFGKGNSILDSSRVPLQEVNALFSVTCLLILRDQLNSIYPFSTRKCQIESNPVDFNEHFMKGTYEAFIFDSRTSPFASLGYDSSSESLGKLYKMFQLLLKKESSLDSNIMTPLDPTFKSKTRKTKTIEKATLKRMKSFMSRKYHRVDMSISSEDDHGNESYVNEEIE